MLKVTQTHYGDVANKDGPPSPVSGGRSLISRNFKGLSQLPIMMTTPSPPPPEQPCRPSPLGGLLKALESITKAALELPFRDDPVCSHGKEGGKQVEYGYGFDLLHIDVRYCIKCSNRAILLLISLLNC